MSYELFNNSASPSTPASAKTHIWANTNKRMFQKDDSGLEWPLASPHRVNVMDYGAKGDGATNDSTAIQNAINAAGAMGVSGRGVDVFFPAGVYALGTATPITVPFNNVMLIGEGWQSTILYYTAGTTGNVLEIGNGTTKSGCGIQNMSVWKSAAATAGDNIKINAMNDCLIRDVVVNNYFRGIAIDSAAAPSLKVWIDHVEINNGTATTGVGIQVTNGAGGDTYITDCVMSNNPASRPAAGIQITQTGHTSILRCNVTSFVKGLHVNPAAAATDVNYLFIDHSLFDSCGTHGAHFNATLNAGARIRSVICVNSWFAGSATAGGVGVQITGSTGIVDGVSFIACRFLNNQQHGVLIDSSATINNVSLTDCTSTGNGQQTINTYDGVSIGANTSNISIVNCGLGQQGTATNQQRYAVNIAAGTSANIQIFGNQCAPNGTVGTHGYINSGALTGGGNVIDGNSPQAMPGVGGATVAASGAINTTETVISGTGVNVTRLSANALRAGTCIRIVIHGSCTITTGAAVPARFIVQLGTAGTTADGEILNFTLPTSGGIGTSAFKAQIDLTCRTAGASGTFEGSMSVVQGSATLGLLATIAWAGTGTATAGNTTNANYLTVTFGNTGSANVTCTFQKVSIEVVVP